MNLRVLQETEEFLGLFCPCCLLSSALVIIIIIIIIIIIGVILSSLSLSPVKLILCSSRGQTLHALPFHTPILRAINIVSNVHSTKLVSYFFFLPCSIFWFFCFCSPGSSRASSHRRQLTHGAKRQQELPAFWLQSLLGCSL